MEDQHGGRRISVSEETLRAALAEMELRLRIYFDEQLKHKADGGRLAEVAIQVDRLDRGDFSDVHRRALTEFVENMMLERTDRGWTARERIFGVVAIMIAVLSFVLSIYVTTAAGSSQAPPSTTYEGGTS